MRAGLCRPRRRLIPAHAGKTLHHSSVSNLHEAHPRSRGENIWGAPCRRCGAGSSPLTRGKHLRAQLFQLVHGLIPAHAGKTGRGRRSRGLLPAHPRSRGENVRVAAKRRAKTGSSPLTRGKPYRRVSLLILWGLIPAHAGKTCQRCHPCHMIGAHPRSRGENKGRVTLLNRHEGSSPLTRGKRVSGITIAAHGRLIPAHAGKTGQLPR